MAEQENRREFNLASMSATADGQLSQQSNDSTTSSGDGQYYYREKAEGYDYEFVPAPDTKYECSICLLVLREPRQTKCGHRFCRGCISKWLRESQSRCPVDNEPIEERDLFSDNFAKREIQNFKVKCPNYKQGCDHVTVLKDIQVHVGKCPLALIPCPNGCLEVLLRRDIADHTLAQCIKRLVHCSHCQAQLVAEALEKHNQTCPAIQVQCDHCQTEMKREQLQEHISSQCPRAPILCPFQPLGCEHKMERQAEQEHMVEGMHAHMLQMCRALEFLLRQFGLPGLPHASQTWATQGLVPEEVSGSSFTPAVLSSLLSNLALFQLGDSMRGAEASGGRARGARGSEIPSRTLYKSLSDNVPLSFQQLQEARRLSYTSRPHTNMGGLEGPSPGGADQQSLVFDPEFQSLKNRNVYQDESLARHEQRLLELETKSEALERQNRELKSKLRSMESEWEGRACNGTFLWRITNYSRVRRQAELGELTALHSPAFYTSLYGYKLCIRVNLNGVESAMGNHLSVFIHFMQGEYDNLLEWPFSGRIILSVLDQNPVPEQRRPFVETLIAKPDLAAFQRPTTTRNHKGFGYMEFVSLNQVERGQYIINDTLIVKAQVLCP